MLDAVVSMARQMTTGHFARCSTWSLTLVDVNVRLSRPRPRDPSTIMPAFSCAAVLMMTSAGLPLSVKILPGSCDASHSFSSNSSTSGNYLSFVSTIIWRTKTFRENITFKPMNLKNQSAVCCSDAFLHFRYTSGCFACHSYNANWFPTLITFVHGVHAVNRD